MPPLDWESLLVVNTDEVDDVKADELYDSLVEFQVEGEDDAVRLRKLFYVTQAVMNVKGEQAKIFEEEMTNAAKNQGKGEARREREFKEEIEKLKMENKNLKRFGNEAGGTTRDAKFLRDEIQDLERQIELLQRDVKDRERELIQERSSSDRYAVRAEDAEKELREAKRIAAQLEEDVRDYQRQLDSQRDALQNRHGDDMEFRQKLTKKNRELSEALEELQNLTDSNNALQKSTDDMKKKLNDAIKEMDRMTDEYIKLKQVLQTTDTVMDQLKTENEILRGQVSDLMDKVKSKGDADDEIMVQVSDKVEYWKQVIAEKDEEVLEYQDEVTRLRQELIAKNMDTDKASVAVLTKAVEERDKQIEIMKLQVDQAAADFETNTAIIEDLKQELNKGGGGPSERQTQRIVQLNSTLKMNEEQLKDAEERMIQAEQDAKDKDKALSEALERMRQYEEGEYGLSDAVAEIKDGKLQVQIRDRQIVELTQHSNKCELKINDLEEENESYRAKLGLDPKEPVDLTEFRKVKAIQQQKDRALNGVLQKEVERLEEERIELKNRIRKLAQQQGQRAAALGLDADDIIAIENFTESLSRKPSKGQQSGSAVNILKGAESEELRMRNEQMERELGRNVKNADKLRQENVEMQTKIKELETENKQLQQGMREINDHLKSADMGVGTEISCPTLDRMLAAIDAKNMQGNYDTTLYMKAQVDNLQGRVDELRKELRESRYEANKARNDLEKKTEKAERLESEMKALREDGAGAVMFQPMSLPEGIAVTSAETISSLNEHLVQVLQEVHLKEETIKKMELALEDYRRKFAVMRHQQGLIYADYIREKKSLETEKQKLEDQLKQTDGSMEENKIRGQELDRLTDTLAQDDVEVRRRLADMTRKITVLRVNEKALTRRYNSLQEVEGHSRKEITRLKNEAVQMEAAVTERLGYLQRFKDMAAFKMAALQKRLDDSVPAVDLEAANKQFNELTEKYRDLLERGNVLVERSEANSGYESEVKRLRAEAESLTKELESEKERSHLFEAALDDLRKQGISSDKNLTDAGLISISKKLTTLEMKELNERQRAEHAHRMYEQQKLVLREVEDRNLEIEQRFAELAKLNLEAQKVERELRDEISNCVTKTISDADRLKIAELEKVEASLREEVSKLKEVAEVASMQAKAYESHQVSRDKEVISMRQQLVDFQAQSDEKTIIGKLHRHIVQLQVSEGTAVRKLEDAENKIRKLNAQVLRLQKQVDDKDQIIYHNRIESHNKAKHLKRNIQNLRRQYSGAIPLSKQEKFAKSMIQLQDDKKAIEAELLEVNKQRHVVEDKLASLELKHSGLEDLIVTLKDGKGAQKVMEWHGKMEGLRLEDLKKKRSIDRFQQQIKYLEGVIKGHEVTLGTLEEESVRQAREFEERQLQWEQREVELERMLSKMEETQSTIADAASKFEEAAGQLPDPSLPVANQLDHAIGTIKKNIRTILETQAESKAMKKQVLSLEAKVRELDSNIISRDKVITELRLRLPATSTRDEIILKATSAATEGAKEEDYESKQALRVAQSTIGSLQARINQKEETIVKYQDLLRQAREDMQEQNKRHEAELLAMQEKIHSKQDAAFSKFKQAALNQVQQAQPDLPSNKQLARLNELEDTVAEQDNGMSALTDKLKQTKQYLEHYKQKLKTTVEAMKNEKERLVQEHKEVVENLEKQITDYKTRLDDQEQKMHLLEEELQSQREANERAPTTTMKALVDRLKNQLAVKEKQHKALSKALVELRGDLVSQAQDNVKANAEENASEYNVQKVVQKQTKEYQDKIEELGDQVKRLKAELRKRRDRETTLNEEMEEIKHDLLKKEKAVAKLKTDKHKLEEEIEGYEKKIERISAMRSQKQGEGNAHEVEQLQRQIRLLTEENKRKQQAEKPYEQKEPQKEKGDEVVARWEESKKWQKIVDRLKGRLKDKETEHEKLQRANDLLKSNLDRANKDKESLEHKLRSASKHQLTGVPATVVRPSHNMEELRNKNFQLEEEVATLRRHLTIDKDTAFQDVQQRNKFLSEKLEELERQLARRSIAGGPGGFAGADSYQQLQEREGNLQKKVLKLSEENIELRFEAEQAKKDIPRLKERVADLQKYVEVLKAEKSALELGTSSRSMGSLGSPNSSLRRIGESGKSTKELEKTISLLKKVVERTQVENEQLKKAPGPVSNEQMEMLHRENDGLKEQLEELRLKMGAQLTDRYSHTQKGTAKIISDYEKLRKEHRKEIEANEKLRIEHKTLQTNHQKQQRDNEDLRKKLELESAKHPSLSSLDSKGWKSVVVTRMYEEKLKHLEDDMEKKSRLLADMKVLLRDAATREQQLLQEKDQLEHKIAVLERFPGGSGVKDSDLIRDNQVQRLTIDRLENEKAELLHELTTLRKHSNPIAGTEADIPSDDILVKLQTHDKVLMDNVEVSTKLKAAQLEIEKLKRHNEKMKKELENFGPEFFDEIEDLKFNYREAVQKNVQYEEKLEQFSQQFGVSVQIPGLPP
ncbi:unnamed protein product [Owenia fusiformis]|uniref:Uncharacterized protein n=1 Tax=Owenia fusiformis TaxID=6347 RepID=A0A8J1TBB6_OWEFU|nr:unnamed protein product [Owenia fusiformis]